jgi:hypothetical protein
MLPALNMVKVSYLREEKRKSLAMHKKENEGA